MINAAFDINERYRVYPALNQVQDKLSGHIVRLEPRIMAVLETLSRRTGELVTREELIHDIWNNYGGGDEGLSQAISFLRKILDDREKKLIQTIPKKGYRLACIGSIYEEKKSGTKQVRPTLNVRSLFRFAMLLYVIGTAAYFIHNSLHQDPAMANRSASLIAKPKPVLSPYAANHFTKKFAPLRSNRKVIPVATNLKSPGVSGIKVLSASALGPAPMLSASTETKPYHLRDTTARVLTALDYQVTTTLQVSTTIE